MDAEITNTKGSSVEPILSMDNIELMRSLNINLQWKVQKLESETSQLKAEIQKLRTQSSAYASLSKDLASMRFQCKKTTMALLNKHEAYEELRKENIELKALQPKLSPPVGFIPSRSRISSPQLKEWSVKKMPKKLFDNVDDSESSDDESFFNRKCAGRPSMGSCGNIANAIQNEEVVPEKLAFLAASNGSLRNRVLLKLHSLKSASTESLESAGRKSFKLEEKAKQIKHVKSSQPEPKTSRAGKVATTSVAKKTNGTTTLKSSTVTTALQRKNATNVTPSIPAKSTMKATPSYRPALGIISNAPLREVKMNTAAIKRSNSNCSTKSTTSNSSKPAFRI